jgi:molybdopterin-guanine dinucleotide biosynthesis protein A
LAEEGDESVEIVATSGMPQAEVTDFVEARRQDVLEKAAEEFVGFELHHGPFAGLAVLVPKADSAIIDGDDPTVCDGVPEDVSGEVLQDTIPAIDRGLDEAVPLLWSTRDAGALRQFFSSHGDELRSEDRRKGSCGHEE